MSFWKRRADNATTQSYLKEMIDDYFNGYINTSNGGSIMKLAERLSSIGMVLYERGQVEFTADVTNPCCDKPKIYIPTIWAMPEYWEEVWGITKDESLAQAVCGIVGAVTHESAHNIYTDNTNLQNVATEYGTRKDDNYIKFLCQVINIVEDMYIDEACRYTPKTRRLSKFTDYMRNITNKLNFERLENVQPEYMKNLAYVGGLLSLEYLEQPELLYPYVDPDIIDFALESYEIDVFHDRIKHAVVLCDMLLKDVTEEQMKQDAQKAEEDGEGEFSICFGDGDGKPQDFDSLDKKTQQKIKDFLEKNADKIKKLGEAINKTIEAKAKELRELFSKEHKKITPKIPRLAGEGKIDDSKVELLDTGRAYSNWYVDKNWNVFARHINNSRSWANKSETIKANGYDIDIDSIPYALKGERRIFVDNSARRVKSPPQVIIRADGSGSTQYQPNGTGKTLRQMILEATCGMMQSLISVNVPFFAFMDTTGYASSRESLAIYKLGCNMLPLNFDEGFKENKNAHNILDRCRNMENTMSSGNNDGFALEYGSMFATDNKRDKVMISLSDGAPSSSRDRNLNSEQYLVQVIGNLRKQGWKVFSISLISEVVKHNDRIYGTKWNVDASTDINGALIELGKQLLKGE